MATPVAPMLRLALVSSGAVSLLALDQGLLPVGGFFKITTTLLLFGVLGPAREDVQRRVRWGLVFSTLGDALLLGRGGLWFQLGLGAFLVTQVCYVRAFWPIARFTKRVWLTLVLGAAASSATVILSYPVARDMGVALPVGVYATVLTATLVTLNATMGGPLRRASSAALGGLLFYLADTSIAFDSFVPAVRLPHPVLFTTGMYWVGQYFIVVAARHGCRARGER